MDDIIRKHCLGEIKASGGKWQGEHCGRQMAGLIPKLNMGCTGSQKTA